MTTFIIIAACIIGFVFIAWLGGALFEEKCPARKNKPHDYQHVHVKAFMGGHENGYVLRDECPYCGDVHERHFVHRIELIRMGLTTEQIYEALYRRGYEFPAKEKEDV